MTPFKRAVKARGLLALLDVNFVRRVYLYTELFEVINVYSKELQSPKLELANAVEGMSAKISMITQLPMKFNTLVEQANQVATDLQLNFELRVLRQKRGSGENLEQEFAAACTCMVQELRRRFTTDEHSVIYAGLPRRVVPQVHQVP